MKKTFSLSALIMVATLAPKIAFAASCAPNQFEDRVFGGGCMDSYDQWMGLIWNWALSVSIPLSIVVLVWAGVLYAGSGGNPEQVGKAKKIMIGVFSGLGLLILARVILTTVLGLPWTI
jgi:hypothetical protein